MDKAKTPEKSRTPEKAPTPEMARIPLDLKSLTAEVTVPHSAVSVDDDFVLCPLCRDRYSRPKLLTCLHTFCEHCLTVHITRAARREVKLKEFACPRCHAFTSVVQPELPLDKWAETLPTNTMLQALLESASLQAEDKLCGSCEEGGETTVASHWCRDCGEPLCDNCLRYHRLMKISRRHKIEEMDSIRKHPKRIVSVPQPCPDHMGKDIELFCADHNTLCCVMCVATEHRRCEKVASIDKLAKQMEEGAVNEELVDKLDSYLDHTKAMKKNREDTVETLNKKKSEILDQVANYRENINILLEKLESTITEEFTKVHNKETEQLKSQIEWCAATQSAIDNARTVLNVANRHCSNAQVFITVQQVIERTITYEESLVNEQKEHFDDKDYSFEIDPSFESFLQSLITVESVGKVHIHRRKARVPAPPGMKLLRDRTAERVIQFDAKTVTDTRNCCLSSVLFLSDRRILLSDQNNQKIKLFTDDGKFVYEQSFTTWPRDVTELGNNKIAVTLPKERKIEILFLGDHLKSLETLRLLDECWGISYSNSRLVVACIKHDKGCLKFLTLDGVEVDSIEDDANGRRLFIKTNYVITNDNGREIYVTDRTKDTLVALTLRKGPAVIGGDEQTPQSSPRKQKARANSTLTSVSERSTTDSETSSLQGMGYKDSPRPNELVTGKDKTKTPAKLDITFDERLEESYNSIDISVNQKTDEKNGSIEDLVQKIGELDRQKPTFEREGTGSTLSLSDGEKSEYDIMYSYSNEILKSAGGVAVDYQGNIYVTGYRSANMHQISQGGSLLKIVLHNLCQPLAVCFEPFGERFIVTETSTVRQNKVQIYKLV